MREEEGRRDKRTTISRMTNSDCLGINDGKILPRVPLPHNTTLISVTTLNC